MADFRKWILALAVVALFTGFASTASAQLITCNGSVPVPTVVRGEGYAELTGDIVLLCSGGVHTTPGQQVPTANISVFVLGVNLTSKLTNTGGSTGTTTFSEAMLIVDEPKGTFITPPQTPQLACNMLGAPDGLTSVNGNGAGVCAITSPNSATATYDGTPYGFNNGTTDTTCTIGTGGTTSYGCGRPNIFHGQQVGTNQIVFGGVPVDSACAIGAVTCTAVRTFRITNLRIDAESLQLASVNQLTSVNAQLAITGNSSITLANNIVTGIATVQLGLGSATIAADKGFLQCSTLKISATSGNAAFSAGMSITLRENFRSSWKAQNLAGVCANDAFSANQTACNTSINPPALAGFYLYNGTTQSVPASTPQNLPGVSYNTETGFYNPTLTDNYGLQTAGLATQGTRLYVRVTNVPGAVALWFPVRQPILNANNTLSGVAVLVNTDTAGGGVYSPAVGTNDANGAIAALTYAQVTVDSTNTGFAVYEVVFADPNSLESVKIVPAISYTSNLTSNPQTPTPNILATVGATGFAPFYSTVGASTNLPRFIPGGPPSTNDLFLISKCACNLLFPWIVSDAGYTSAIVVSNTSLDPCLTYGFISSTNCNPPPGTSTAPRGQNGKVSFWRFGQAGTTPVTSGTAVVDVTPILVSPTVPAGQFTTWVIPTGFAGYVIAQAEFQYCHGLAFLFSTTAPPLNYLGLILDKGGVLPRTTQTAREEDAN